MSVQLPNGTTFAIATAYGTSKNMTAVTNASTGVATLEASHGISTGDFFEVTSGWSRLTNKIVRATLTTDATDVEFDGYDTSSTTIYAAGTGTGSVREISGWTQLQQILTTSTESFDRHVAVNARASVSAAVSSK